jgi:hypothetical protein
MSTFQPRKGTTTMSPQAGKMLVDQIAPRLKTIVPSIKTVGCEDKEELYQDGLALAAKMLDTLEKKGKVVTAGNVVYYIALHLKSGRRSYGCGRTDAMFSTTQLDGKACVLSFETEVGYDFEMDEAIHLGDMLSCSTDDPSMRAARNLDWAEFLETSDRKHKLMLGDLADGNSAATSLKKKNVSYPEIARLKGELAFKLKEQMGQEILADALRPPAWRASLMVERERAACRVH